jgi:PBP1b-binding outer membrane lipoprotein LpoB
MNKRPIAQAALTIAVAAFATGCASPTTYVDPQGSRLITSVGKIDIQDFAQAADTMTQSLIDNQINPDKLQSAAAGQPALMAISRIQNNTGQQLDTDLLVKKIRVALNRTGKIQTSTTVGLGGPEDPIAADQQKLHEFLDDKKHARLPDYTLSGKIVEVREKAGNTRQASYVFQLSLSSTSGIAVWEEEKTIVKQGSRPSVGF